MSYLNASYSIVGTNYSVPIRDAMSMARPANSASLGALQFPVGPYYWVGSSLSWTNGNGWAFSSGGTPNGYYIPSAADSVTFDIYSGACSITTSVACGTVTFTSFANTITMAGTLTVNGSIVPNAPIGAKLYATSNSSLLISGSGSNVILANADNFGSLSINAVNGAAVSAGYYPVTPISIKANSIVAGSGGTVNCYVDNSVYITGIVAQSGGTVTGGTNFIQAQINPGSSATGLTVINANVTGYGILGGWIPNSNALVCDCYVNVAQLSASGNTVGIWGANYIYGSSLYSPASGVNIVIGSTTITSSLVYIGPIVNISNLAATTLNIADASTVSLALTDVGALIIDSCASIYTMSLNSTSVANAFSVSGSSKLVLTSTVTYGGIRANSIFKNVSVYNSDASSGNTIYALGAGVKNLGGNVNWVFPVIGGHAVYSGVGNGVFAGVG